MKKSIKTILISSVILLTLVISGYNLLSPPLPDSKINFYAAMEGNGNMYSGVSGNATPITVSNVTFDSLYGSIGQGALFNGTSSNIKYSGSIMSMSSGAKTFVLHFRTNDTTNSYFCGTASSSGTNKSYQVEIHNGTVTFRAYNNSGTNFITLNASGSYNDSVWHYVRVTKSIAISAKYRLFVDEIVKDSITTSTTIKGIASPAIFAIGSLGTYTTAGFYKGQIDRVGVINGTLSQSELDSLKVKQPPF